MNKISEQQNKVSETYQSLRADEHTIAPLESTDMFIRQAAVNAIAHDRRKRNRYLLPLSAAATIFIVAGVVLKMAVFSNDVTVNSGMVNNKKQPMYMLQRSKPAAAEVMLQQIHKLMQQDEIAQAQSLYNKFLHRYPLYEVDSDLREKLQ